MLSRPGHGFVHIEEGPSAVRALAFEGGKFSLESPGAGHPLKIAEHVSRINDGRAHRGAHRRVDVHTAIECSDFSEFGMTTFLLFFDTPLANPPLRQHTCCSAKLGGLATSAYNGHRGRIRAPQSRKVYCEAFEIGKRAVRECTLVRGAQHHARCLACLECFLPAGHTEALTVTCVQSWKAEGGNWCRKIVSARF